MGWTEVWETANNWKNTAWTQATTLRYKTIPILDMVESTAQFTYTTVAALVEEVAALPATFKSIVFQLKPRRTALHLARIAAEDYASLIAAYQFKTYLEYSLIYALQGRAALWPALMLLSAAHTVYDFRKRSQIGIRVTMVAIEASGTMTSANPNLEHMGDVCVKNHCSKLSAILGSLSDLIKYTVTDYSISWVKKIPVISPVVGDGLATKHTGDYILTSVLKGMCPDHVRVYLQEYPEWAWALGFTHTLATNSANSYIEQLTGIPQDLYKPIVNLMAVVGLIAVAAHMRLPSPVATSKRTIPDPIRYYKAGLQWGLDVIGNGLKAKIPEMLKNESVVPWGWMFSKVETLWHHPSTQIPKKILLPPMLHGKKSFYLDPVVKPNWESLRSRLVKSIEVIEALRQKYLVNLMTQAPKLSAKIAALLGAPKPVVALFLKLIADEAFMQNLAVFRRLLETMHVNDMPADTLLRQITPLNSELNLIDSPTIEQKEPLMTMPATLLIEGSLPQGSLSPEILLQSESKPKRSPLHQFSLFSDPALGSNKPPVNPNLLLNSQLTPGMVHRPV